MKTEYVLTHNKILTENGESFISYGIRTANIIDCCFPTEFDDVSIDKSFAIKILDILNKYEVEPCHFFDVVIDELNR